MDKFSLPLPIASPSHRFLTSFLGVLFFVEIENRTRGVMVALLRISRISGDDQLLAGGGAIEDALVLCVGHVISLAIRLRDKARRDRQAFYLISWYIVYGRAANGRAALCSAYRRIPELERSRDGFRLRKSPLGNFLRAVNALRYSSQCITPSHA